MPLILQHLVVTLVALGALGVIVRRVVGTVRPAPGASPCSTCAAGTAVQARRPAAAGVHVPVPPVPDARQAPGSRRSPPGGVEN